MATKTAKRQGLTRDEFKAKLDDLLKGQHSKIWLLKSVAGRVDVMFSAGDAQGKPIVNFDHIGGFYLMGENVPDEFIPIIHKWFLDFSKINFNPYRLERHFIDTKQRAFYDLGRRYRDELLMHVPFSVHSTEDESGP